MSDTSEPQKPPVSLRDQVLDALHAYRRLVLGELTPPTGIELHESPLAHIPAVRALCWAENPSRAQLTAAMKSLLEWAVEQLRPWETADPRSPAALRYRAMTAHYLRGQSWAQFNQDNEIDDHNRLRASGIKAVEQTIAAVIHNPDELENLPRRALDERLRRFDPEARRLLEFIATVNQEVTLRELEEAAAALPCDSPAARVRELLDARLLAVGDRDDRYRVASEAGPAVVLAAIADRAQRNHYGQLAARLFEHREDYLNAARRWRESGHFKDAAALLIEKSELLANRSQTLALLELVDQFSYHELRDWRLYAELHIAAGLAATTASHAQDAIATLQKALIDDDLLYCRALHYLGKAYQAFSLDIAMEQYRDALARLDKLSPDERRTLHSGEVLTTRALRFDVLLGVAWVYIQGKDRLDEAVLLLAQADHILNHELTPPGDDLRACDLHNAWAGYHKKRGNRDAEIESRRKAYAAAGKTTNSKARIMTAHNLGQALVFMGRPRDGLEFLAIALELARKAQNRRDEGMFLKAMGIAHFFDGDYPAAIERYKEALAVFRDLGNEAMQGYVTFDLAEAYGALNQVAALRYYYEMARDWENTTGNDELKGLLDGLLAKHPLALDQPLDEQEIRILQMVFNDDERRVTTGRVYKMLGMSSPSAAQKALKKMVGKGLLRMVKPGGNDRKAYYTLPGDDGSGLG